MPKIARTQEEIDAVKDEILDTALDLILSDGFNNLSMRKIASRLGMTATTIYNYYASKDELNLMIRMRGFEMLYRMLMDEYESHSYIIARGEAMIRAYVEFGITYPGYYDLMFNLQTPKYSDYIGTDIEGTAALEKESAMKCFYIFAGMVKDYLGGSSNNDDDMISYRTIQYWCDLHGIISLYNSRVLYEVREDARDLLWRRVDDLVAALLRLKEALDAGEPVV